MQDFFFPFFLLRPCHLINSCHAFLKSLPVTKPEMRGRETLLELSSNQEAKSSKLHRKNKTPVVTRNNSNKNTTLGGSNLVILEFKGGMKKNQGTKAIVHPGENQYLDVDTSEQ